MGGSHATILNTPVEAATTSTAVLDSSLIILVRPDNWGVFASIEMNEGFCDSYAAPTVGHCCFD